MTTGQTLLEPQPSHIQIQAPSEPLGIGFRTPGLIDVRSFTTFGFNSKPMTDNPIGFFGTGLKYAIAVLMRHKIPLVIWIGSDRYEFEPLVEDFRGKEFVAIHMKRSYGLMKRFTKERLPFTTELGKNWELWQAFRELESNTRDEQGETDYIYQDPLKWEGYQTGRTVILVGDQKFVDVYNERDKVFLDRTTLELRFHDTRNGVEVFNQPSRHVYYRGMRVYDLPKDKVSKYTYNFTRAMDLTEDRTLKYTFYMFMYLANVVIESNDDLFVKAIVGSDKDSFENEFSFDSSYATPSETFKRVMAEKKGHMAGVSSFYGRYAPSPPKKTKPKYAGLLGDILAFLQDTDDATDADKDVMAARNLLKRALKWIPKDLGSDSLNAAVAQYLADSPPDEEPLDVPEVILEKRGITQRRADLDDEVPF